MNNPNPFVPQGSVLEQNKRRSRMKLAVFCVLAVSVCGLTAMLIQGCKREQSTENTPQVDTNPPPMMDTNLPPAMTNAAGDDQSAADGRACQCRKPPEANTSSSKATRWVKSRRPTV